MPTEADPCIAAHQLSLVYSLKGTATCAPSKEGSNEIQPTLTIGRQVLVINSSVTPLLGMLTPTSIRAISAECIMGQFLNSHCQELQ